MVCELGYIMTIKTAVDTAAKDYWKLLFGDYGEQLVKDIPRRVKAALVTSNKVAAVSDDGVVLPIAHKASDSEVVVEGVYRDASNKMMFLATILVDGTVKDVKAFGLK